MGMTAFEERRRALRAAEAARVVEGSAPIGTPEQEAASVEQLREVPEVSESEPKAEPGTVTSGTAAPAAEAVPTVADTRATIDEYAQRVLGIDTKGAATKADALALYGKPAQG